MLLPFEKKLAIMSDRPAKQHIVPRFYLERFTDGNGMVWNYDFKNNRVFAQKALETAIVKNFYSPVKDDGQRNDGLERLLAHIESNAAPLWRDLENGKLMIGADRVKIALFVASQYLRSPAYIGATAEWIGKIRSRSYQMLAANPSAFNKAADSYDLESGTESSPEQRERVRNIVLDGKFSTGVLHTEGLVAFRSVEKVAKILMMMNWVVYQSAHQHLITSDNPVALISDPKTHSHNYGDDRFVNKTVRVSLPLSADRIIEMTWKGNETEGLIDIPKDVACHFNAIRANAAVGFLYCNQNGEEIRKLGNKRVGNSFEPVKVPAGLQTPEVVVKRSFGSE